VSSYDSLVRLAQQIVKAWLKAGWTIGARHFLENLADRTMLGDDLAMAMVTNELVMKFFSKQCQVRQACARQGHCALGIQAGNVTPRH